MFIFFRFFIGYLPGSSSVSLACGAPDFVLLSWPPCIGMLSGSLKNARWLPFKNPYENLLDRFIGIMPVSGNTFCGPVHRSKIFPVQCIQFLPEDFVFYRGDFRCSHFISSCPSSNRTHPAPGLAQERRSRPGYGARPGKWSHVSPKKHRRARLGILVLEEPKLGQLSPTTLALSDPYCFAWVLRSLLCQRRLPSRSPWEVFAGRLALPECPQPSWNRLSPWQASWLVVCTFVLFREESSGHPIASVRPEGTPGTATGAIRSFSCAWKNSL